MTPEQLILISFLLPLAGAVVLALRPCKDSGKAALFAIACTAISLALHLTGSLCRISEGFEWSLSWIGDGEIQLRFVHDGLSFLFVCLTQVVVLISLVSARQQKLGSRAFYGLILVLETALFGVFVARHFVPWFLCWEMTLIPSYLLIRMWGSAGAPKAALRFFIMTLAGSAFMLVGFLAMQLSVGSMDFDVLGKLAAANQLTDALGVTFKGVGLCGTTALLLVASAVFLGLAVKLPVVPFHAWLPAAYAEAPTPVTMLLTGLLSKMGVYGLLRVFLPVFPEVLPMMAPCLAILAVATVLLGAVAALAQRDLKRMLAYSSVNHLGYCALAITAVAGAGGVGGAATSSALSGAVLQAINHGVIATGLFYGIAMLETRSGGKRGISDFGGLRAQAPVLTGAFGLVIFASLGLPGLSGFIGEFLIFNGVFALMPVAATLSVLGLLLTAVFLLRMIRKVFTGPLNPELNVWKDLSGSERVVFGVLIALIVIPGIFPQVLLHFSNSAIVPLLDLLSTTP